MSMNKDTGKINREELISSLKSTAYNNGFNLVGRDGRLQPIGYGIVTVANIWLFEALERIRNIEVSIKELKLIANRLRWGFIPLLKRDDRSYSDSLVDNLLHVEVLKIIGELEDGI